MKLCDWCGEKPADANYQEVIGITSRSNSNGGGNNLLIAREYTGRSPCWDCYRKLRDGVAIGQEQLF